MHEFGVCKTAWLAPSHLATKPGVMRKTWTYLGFSPSFSLKDMIATQATVAGGNKRLLRKVGWRKKLGGWKLRPEGQPGSYVYGHCTCAVDVECGPKAG